MAAKKYAVTIRAEEEHAHGYSWKQIIFSIQDPLSLSHSCRIYNVAGLES